MLQAQNGMRQSALQRILTETPATVYALHHTIDEREFQSYVERFASNIFPQCTLARWDPIIRDSHGRAAKPDAVIICEALDTWFVVEIELGHHSISRHIAPQLETLSKGIYDASLAPTMDAAFPWLSPEYIRHLLAYRQPGFLCIVDDASDRLRSTCHDYDFELVELQPFRSGDGNWALSITNLPSLFRIDMPPGRYYLRLGGFIGDRVQVFFPSHFPLWAGTVSVFAPDGGMYQCPIHDRPHHSMFLPRQLVSSSRALSLSILDIAKQIVRLEEE